jgi:hypothetical protein
MLYQLALEVGDRLLEHPAVDRRGGPPEVAACAGQRQFDRAPPPGLRSASACWNSTSLLSNPRAIH